MVVPRDQKVPQKIAEKVMLFTRTGKQQIRKSSLEFDQEPGGVTTSPRLLDPVLV